MLATGFIYYKNFKILKTKKPVIFNIFKKQTRNYAKKA